MSTTRSIRAWRLAAATVPTRWPVPRPDAGRPSAAAGGSGGFAIGCSCRGDLLCRPAEFAAVAPHAMEDDRELAGYGDGGLLGADPLRQACPPGFQRRPARDTMQDDPGRLVQVGAQQLVAAAGDVAGVVRLAGLVAPRRQADVGSDAGRLGEALRRIHDTDVGERDQDTNTGCGHQPPRRLVLPGHGHEPAAEHRDLLADGLPGRQQRPSHLLQGPARDQRPHPLGEGPPPPLPAIRPKGLRTPRIWLARSTRMRTSCARVVSRERTRWLSTLLTATSRYQPVRTICARPRASLRSDLFSCKASAALACRASRQTTGRPAFLSSCQCQADMGPLSRPMRTTSGALARTVAAIASGVEAHLPCQSVLPLPSTTQTEVCSWETSRPTY